MGGNIGDGGHHFIALRKSVYGNSVPYIGPWFGKFMRRYKLSIGVIKRQDFGLTLGVAKAMLVR